MWGIRKVATAIAVLAFGVSAFAGEYLPLATNTPGHITDLVLLYQGGQKRLDYTREQIEPYVTWTGGTANGESWLFDGFLFIEFSDGRGKEYAAGYTGNPATKAEWSWLLGRNFSSTNALGALEQTVQGCSDRIGRPPVPRKVVLTLPEPIFGQTNWGMLKGRSLDFSKSEDRIAACEWHVEEALARWRKFNARHIQLAGFYWVAEQDHRAREILPQIGALLRKRGMCFYWIPYWRAGGAADWRKLGFDYAWQQPNHFFHPDKVKDSRLEEATAFARLHGLGLEFEMDSRAIKETVSFRPRFFKYLEVFDRAEVKHSASVAYYEGGGALLQMAGSSDPKVRGMYDTLAGWVADRQKRADVRRGSGYDSSQ